MMMPLDDADAAQTLPPSLPSESPSCPESQLAAANASRAWPRAYSTALGKSVKAMMRRRRMGESGDGDQQQQQLQQQQSDERALQRLLLAVDSKEPHEMLAAVAQNPHALRQSNEDERLALHVVCTLVPNFLFVDVIGAMVRGCEESAGCMDTTPLHVLCLNPSVTSQAIELLVSALPECVAMCDKRLNLPLHYICGNSACEPKTLRRLGADGIFGAMNAVGSEEASLLSVLRSRAAAHHLLTCRVVLMADDRNVAGAANATALPRNAADR
ncbi:hypothetical protein PybrP1_011154 [[Pythium] brassicae (nom. inval.)]|nr:hypothetical protein PybrP1_011154 [[Pythium] brassicae (nom. inval.)]